MKKSTAALGVSAVLAGVLGCGEDEATKGNVIPIGVFQRMGAEANDELVAIREINAAGGLTVDGVDYTLGMVRELQGETGASGVMALDRFVAQGVFAAVGPRWSSVTLGDLPDHSDGAGLGCASRNVLCVSAAATNAAITDLEDNDMVWRTVPSDALQGVGGVNHAYDDRGARTAAILYRDDVWGQDLAATFQQAFEARGGQITVSVGYDPSLELTSYAFPELAQVFADMPDVIYMPAFEEISQITNRIAQARYLDAYGATPPGIVSTDGAFDNDLLLNGAPSVLPLISGTAPGLMLDDPGFIHFADAYVAAGLGTFDNAWPYPYDAIYVIALAIQSAQSLDPQVFKQHMQAISRDDGGDTSIGVDQWADAKAALLAGDAIDYQGASGPIDFTDKGDPSRGIFMLWQVVSDGNGGFVFDQSNTIPYQVQ